MTEFKILKDDEEGFYNFSAHDISWEFHECFENVIVGKNSLTFIYKENVLFETKKIESNVREYYEPHEVKSIKFLKYN